ncbi:MAG: tryptophan--tRNA ligase [Candidatus Berkelbacteria bacterium]|nr:tryptophan--tRNA ligase [Candidatus Berkelbacteria bacterium]
MDQNKLNTKRIFSGIQPSGVLHLGNYLGAISQFVKLQGDTNSECIFCIVDLHAITVPQDPKILREKILELAALYLACGIDPTKSTLFVQSSRPEHSELAWILNCFTNMGELNRMTQFKEKSENKSNYSVGLFDYPVLMAADILLYQTTHVPVGEDQKQHIEITRDLCERMNNKYNGLFTLPEPMINKQTARIMSLDDPNNKMSKSSPSPSSYIGLTDSPEIIREKIKRAVTDSGSEIKSGEDKPAISNLLNIFAAVTDREIADIEKDFEGNGYGEFKDALAQAVISKLAPIQEKYNKLIAGKDELRKILADGSAKIAPIAQKTLSEVKKSVGLG